MHLPGKKSVTLVAIYKLIIKYPHLPRVLYSNEKKGLTKLRSYQDLFSPTTLVFFV